MKAFYEAYVPSYAVSYDVLGDQEAMTLKYTWELAIYFSFYVFPFINDLFTDQRFISAFFSRFGRLGPINKNLQCFINAYYHWKKNARLQTREPIFNDFSELAPLREAERTFYSVGISVDDARLILDKQLANLQELARFIVAHIAAAVLEDEQVLLNREFVESIAAEHEIFDVDKLR